MYSVGFLVMNAEPYSTCFVWDKWTSNRVLVTIYEYIFDGLFLFPVTVVNGSAFFLKCVNKITVIAIKSE